MASAFAPMPVLLVPSSPDRMLCAVSPMPMLTVPWLQLQIPSCGVFSSMGIQFLLFASHWILCPLAMAQPRSGPWLATPAEVRIKHRSNYNSNCKSNCKSNYTSNCISYIANRNPSVLVLRASRNGSSGGNCFTEPPCSTNSAKAHRTLNLIMSTAFGSPGQVLSACMAAKVFMSRMQMVASWRSSTGKFDGPLQFCSSG